MEEAKKRRTTIPLVLGLVFVVGAISGGVWAVNRDEGYPPNTEVPYGDLRFSVQFCARENVRQQTRYKVRVLIANKGKEMVRLDASMVRAYQTDDLPLFARPDLNKGVYGFAPDRGISVDLEPGEKNITWYVFTGPAGINRVRLRFYPRGNFGDFLDSLTVGKAHVDAPVEGNS